MKVMVGVVIALLLIFVVVLFRPTDSNMTNNVVEKESMPEQTLAASLDDKKVNEVLNEQIDEDLKYQQMTDTYQTLEKARTRLKRKLSRLNHELWGQTFPKEQASEFNELMLNAHKLIKNPYKLGAFSSVKEIQNEIDAVTFAGKALDEVFATLKPAEESLNAETSAVNSSSP